MPTDPFDRAEVMLKHAPPENVDDYARKQLRVAIQAYQRNAGRPLGRVAYHFKGRTFADLHLLLSDAPTPTPLEIRFAEPDRSQPWDYDTPAHRMVIGQEGRGILEYFPIDRSKLDKWADADVQFLERGMIRAAVTRAFVPQTIDQVSSDPHAIKPRLYAPRLLTLDHLQEDLRKKGIVPLEMAFHFYTQEQRFRFRVSLPDNLTITDFRTGKLPNRGEVHRSVLDVFAFDRLHAFLDLPEVPKRFWRVAFMLDTVRAEDLMIPFGVSRQIAYNNLNSLFTKGLLDREGTGQNDPYFINMAKLHEFADTIPVD